MATKTYSMQTRALSKKQAQAQRIRSFLSKYKIKFDVTENYIDLRKMSENYNMNIIPIADIGEAVSSLLGPSSITRLSIDPRPNNKVPKFDWVHIDHTAVLAKFQRDASTLHIAEIIKLFDEGTIIVPCSVKLVMPDGTFYYLLWDGHHTVRVLERLGWSHVPMWFTEFVVADENNLEKDLEALVRKAGKCFLTINSTGKKGLTQYDNHLIRTDIKDPEAVAINGILHANGCELKHSASAKSPGDIGHVVNTYRAYDLTQATTGVKGIYLSKALKFHRTIWPREKINSVLMRSMAMLYFYTEQETGILLDPGFDKEMGNILQKIYGFAGAVTGTEKEAAGLRKAYMDAFKVSADIPSVVLAGLILTYNKHGSNTYRLAQPAFTYPVD